MDAQCIDKRVMLVRSGPGAREAASALERCRQWLASGCDELIVFFHGEGVAHAADGEDSAWALLARHQAVTLEICSAAWQRRVDQPVPSPFRKSTLVQFWHHADGACETDCCGMANE